MCKERLWCVELRSAAADAPALEEWLVALGFDDVASWTSIDADESVLRIYVADQALAQATLTSLNARLPEWLPFLAHGTPVLLITTVPREEWAESWKAYFHTFRASPRLIVSPSWETYSPAAGEIIVQLDPGMCFGTGHHGTTRACLEFMDRLSERLGRVSFLDAGCGSGILALAAAKLGFHPVVAFDHDPDALAVASANLQAAGITDVAFARADAAEFEPATGFRVVAANILADVLTANAKRIVRCLKCDMQPSFLLLAGMLSEQYAQVKARYEALGLREVETRTIDEWTSACFELRNPPSRAQHRRIGCEMYRSGSESGTPPPCARAC